MTGRRLDAIDTALVVVYLLGLYLGVSLQITAKIPLTCAPSGAAMSSTVVNPKAWPPPSPS